MGRTESERQRQSLQRNRRGQRLFSVDLRQRLVDNRLPRVDRGGDLEIMACERAMPERRCGQPLAQPGIPAAALAVDCLAKTGVGGGVLTDLEGDRAGHPAGYGAQRIQIAGRVEITQRSCRVALA